jgi:hypothetical protein
VASSHTAPRLPLHWDCPTRACSPRATLLALQPHLLRTGAMSVLNGKGVCSAIYFLNLRGDVLIHRAYRDDVGCVHACAVALVGLPFLLTQ